MEVTEKMLLEKKKEIKTAKEKLSEAKGEEKALKNQLLQDWGINTLPEAKAKIESLRAEIQKLNTRIETKTAEVKHLFEDKDD